MKIQNRTVSGLTVLCLLFAGPSAAQEKKSIDSKALEVSDFKNLKFLVETVPGNSISLSTEAVKNRTDVHLRSAGIRTDVLDTKGEITAEFLNYVYVKVGIVGPAFAVIVTFEREACWPVEAERVHCGIISTWHTEALGAHANQTTGVMNALDAMLDKFLSAYLKANQD